MTAYKPITSDGIVYVRNQDQMQESSDGCTPTIEVLAWLMDEVNARMGTLMITYGGLIHLYREKVPKYVLISCI